MLTRSSLLAVTALFVAAAPFPHSNAAAEAAAAAGPARPNIILCMADDLGWADTGYNGHPVLKTPNLDAMAAAGLRFDRFYAAAPVCSPTRASVLTGRHPYRQGIFFANVGHMRPQELTLAEALRTLGYATGHFGKWHLGTLTRTEKDSNRGGPGGASHYSPPWDNGFDTCFCTEAKVPTWDPMLRPAGVRRSTWWDPVASADDARPFGTAYWTNGRRVVDDLRGDDSRLIMDRALPFIRGAVAAKKPFLAVIWFHAPHLPVVAGPKYTAMYAGQDKYAQHYFGSITAMDEQVGRLRQTLRDLGVADNTMLWFCSDNGPEGKAGAAPGSARPLRGRKRDLLEGGVRVPGILEWPARIKPGRRTDLPACTVDYMPTIMDLLALTPDDQPQPIDGISLMPLIDGDMTRRPRPIAFESRNQIALIDNRYKIIQRGGKDAPMMLFDLLADPAESHDVAADHKDLVASMTAALTAWRASCKASLAGDDYAK